MSHLNTSVNTGERPNIGLNQVGNERQAFEQKLGNNEEFLKVICAIAKFIQENTTQIHNFLILS